MTTSSSARCGLPPPPHTASKQPHTASCTTSSAAKRPFPASDNQASPASKRAHTAPANISNVSMAVSGEATAVTNGGGSDSLRKDEDWRQ